MRPPLETNGRFGGHARRERPSPRLTIESWKLASRLFSGGNRAEESQCGGVTCRARRTFGKKDRVRGWDRQAIFFGERGNFVWLIVSLTASLELIFHALSPPVLRPCPLLGQTQKFNHQRPAQVQQLGIVLKRYILKSRSNGGCRKPRGIERQAWQPRRRTCRHRRDRIVRVGKWSEWRDSNSRPSGPKPDALPGCATLRGLAAYKVPGLAAQPLKRNRNKRLRRDGCKTRRGRPPPSASAGRSCGRARRPGCGHWKNSRGCSAACR